MSARKKEFEDNVVIYKQEQGQSKDDTWLSFETKVTGAANNLHDTCNIILAKSPWRAGIWMLPQAQFVKVNLIL